MTSYITVVQLLVRSQGRGLIVKVDPTEMARVERERRRALSLPSGIRRLVVVVVEDDWEQEVFIRNHPAVVSLPSASRSVWRNRSLCVVYVGCSKLMGGREIGRIIICVGYLRFR